MKNNLKSKLKNVPKIVLILALVLSASIIMKQDKSNADAGYHSSYSGGSSSSSHSSSSSRSSSHSRK